MFEERLGNAYSPETQWTSSLRSRDIRYKPYEYGDKYTTTFTIEDNTGAFAKFLNRAGYERAARWRNHPTFHIEVITTEEGLKDSRFYLDANQVEKVSSFPQPTQSVVRQI